MKVNPPTLPWWYGIVEDEDCWVRYISDGEYGLVLRKRNGSMDNYMYDESDIAIWMTAPTIPEPKQQRPAH